MFQSPTTVLVENNRSIRRSQFALLQDLGYREVLMAENGAEGWALIKKMKVGLVISAWQLGFDMSGLGLLRVIRADEAYKEIPFVLVADEVTKTQVIEAGDSGVSDIIIRPFTRETFKAKIERAVSMPETPESRETKILMDQGRAFLQQGKYEEALTSFKKVLTISESAEVYFNLGYIQTAQGRYEEAILAFRRATQINQTFAQAHKLMGEAYARLGRLDESRECLEKAADIFMDKQMDQDAEQVFLQVLAVSPNTPNIYNSLGIVYRRQGKFPEAIRMYQKALRVSPQDEHLLYNLGKVLLSVNRVVEAADYLAQAVQINPDFAEAENLLQSIRLGQGLG